MARPGSLAAPGARPGGEALRRSSEERALHPRGPRRTPPAGFRAVPRSGRPMRESPLLSSRSVDLAFPKSICFHVPEFAREASTGPDGVGTPTGTRSSDRAMQGPTRKGAALSLSTSQTGTGSPPDDSGAGHSAVHQGRISRSALVALPGRRRARVGRGGLRSPGGFPGLRVEVAPGRPTDLAPRIPFSPAEFPLPPLRTDTGPHTSSSSAALAADVDALHAVAVEPNSTTREGSTSFMTPTSRLTVQAPRTKTSDLASEASVVSRAKTECGEDAGRTHGGAMCPTEDKSAGRFAAASDSLGREIGWLRPSTERNHT
jgi:hypothetical protein